MYRSDYHLHTLISSDSPASLEQQAQALPGGKYKFTVSIMGGDAGICGGCFRVGLLWLLQCFDH